MNAGAGVLLATAVAGTGAAPAFATFPGSGDGDLVFASTCNLADANGQQIWSLADLANSSKCAGYTDQTAGSADAMPYFSASGTTLYFSSNRSGTWAIYSVPYPNAANADDANATDGATQLTNLSGQYNDYAPTVTADSTELAFIRCGAGAAPTCEVVEENLVGSSTGDASARTLTSGGVTGSSDGNGTANRPEFDPANPNYLLYVAPNPTNGSATNIYLLSVDTGSAVDLSTESAAGSASDEHPDWAPDGNAIVFDSTRSSGSTNQVGYALFFMSNVFSGAPAVTAAPTTVGADQAGQIEPVYAPFQSGADIPSATYLPDIAFIEVAKGSNVADNVAAVDSSSEINPVTGDTQTNEDVTWQPEGPPAQAPESPLTVGIPLAGGVVLLGGAALIRRRAA